MREVNYMAFQAPKWTHVTLPSVEGVNILRDPPKSIVTRRITKVGEDNTLNSLVDGSADRVSEAIRVYARGTNPMVEVSYNNFSNNGARGTSYASRQAQAYLPYRIMDGGAYRAPIVAPADLLPLSRLPRAHTFAKANPGFSDFTKLIACGTNAKNNKNTVQGSIAPTKFLKREKLVQMDGQSRTKHTLHSNMRSNPRGFTKIEFGDGTDNGAHTNTNVVLSNNRPNGVGYTNLSAMKTATQHNPETTVIKRRLQFDEYEGRPQMRPEFIHPDTQKIVSGVGYMKPGNRQTRIA